MTTGWDDANIGGHRRMGHGGTELQANAGEREAFSMACSLNLTVPGT